jgi:hypothetical protein
MPKQPHPADVRNGEIVARAVRYDLALFLGRGAYAKASVSALDEVPAVAARLVLEHRNGRRPLIYAIDAAGRSALIDYRLPEATKEPMKKTYAKRFNAQRAARAAGYDLADIEIVKTAGGFSWRPKAAKAATAKAASKQGERPRMTRGRFAEIEAAAREGVLPDPPDFSAATHARFRNKLAVVVALAEAGDLDGLRTFEINPVSSSPKAIKRYRDLCIIALEARK